MANADDKPTLKITLEDLEKVAVLPGEATLPAGTAETARQYGNISMPGAEPVTRRSGLFGKGAACAALTQAHPASISILMTRAVCHEATLWTATLSKRLQLSTITLTLITIRCAWWIRATPQG